MVSLMNIRTNQKAIIWSFLGVFILSLSIGGLVGGANLIDEIFGSNLAGDAVGAVNRDRISIEELSQAIAQQSEAAREQYGELTDRLVEQAEEQAWQRLIANRIILAELEKLEIGTDGFEIGYILDNYPPTVLQSSAAFQTDGKFDPDKYFQIRRDPQGLDWGPIVTYLADLVPNEKLTQLVRAAAFVSEEEVKEAWVNRNVRATIDYIYVANLKIDPAGLAVSDAEIEARYRKNRKNYRVPERRILEYVAWPKRPIAVDSLSTYEDALDLLDRARTGESFGELAGTYSQDPGSGAREGDLGWFERERMVAPFSEAAFAAEVGEFVGPVLSRFGYHVIHVRDRKTVDGKEQVLASHILLNIEMTSESLNSLRNDANIFTFDALDSSFAIASRRQNLTSTLSGPLDAKTTTLPLPVGRLRSAVHFAFDAEEEEISDVMESEDAFIVARLARIQPAGIQPLEEVRVGIERQLQQEMAAGQVDLVMANIQSQIEQGTSWKAIAFTVPESDVRMLQTTTLGGAFPRVGPSASLTGLLKGLQPDELSGIVPLERGQIIVRLISRTEPDWTLYPAAREEEHRKLLQRRMDGAWGLWLQDMMDAADIIDNRHRFF